MDEKKVETNDEVFVRITNKDIYNEIRNLTKVVTDFKSNNNIGHSKIIQHQRKTNGRVNLNKWIATTALSFVIIVIGFLVQHVARNGG